MQLETDSTIGTSQNGLERLIEKVWEENREGPANPGDEPAGYSGIALQVLRALHGTRTAVTTINTINGSTVPCLDPGDIVEVQCYIDQNGVHPYQIEGTIPEHCRGLLQAVKSYERLAVQAALTQSYDLALQALAVHPWFQMRWWRKKSSMTCVRFIRTLSHSNKQKRFPNRKPLFFSAAAQAYLGRNRIVIRGQYPIYREIQHFCSQD